MPRIRRTAVLGIAVAGGAAVLLLVLLARPEDHRDPGDDPVIVVAGNQPPRVLRTPFARPAVAPAPAPAPVVETSALPQDIAAIGAPEDTEATMSTDEEVRALLGNTPSTGAGR